MTKQKSTKKAFLASLLSLLLCCVMLIGTTFAWFTDSVTSSGNIIKSGNLKVTLEWMDGTEAVAEKDSDTWLDASQTAIFDYELWEPGYTVARHIKVGNEGTLAMKYQLFIQPVGVAGALADVIDVYLFEEAKAIESRTDLAGVEPVGTLSEVIDGFATMTYGELAANTAKTFTIVLKMQESAGNEYQDQSIGTSFAVKLLATQLAAESDSFDSNYDAGAMVADYTATPATIQEMIYAAKSGEIIALSAGTYDKLVISDAKGDAKDGITLVGTPDAVVGVLDLHRSSNIVIKDIAFDAAKTAYTVSSFNGTVRTQHSNILDLSTGIDTKGSNKGAHHIAIENCTFTGNANDVENYAVICLYEQRRASGPAHDITVNNCTFALDAQQYISLNYLEGGVVTVTNNIFGGNEYKTYHNAINASSNGSNWVVNDNTFYNWNPEKALFGSSYNGTTKVTVDVQENTLINYRAEAVNVLNIKNSYNATNLDLIYENNTANSGLYEFASEIVVDANDNYYQMKPAASTAVVDTIEEFWAAMVNDKIADVKMLAGTYDFSGKSCRRTCGGDCKQGCSGSGLHIDRAVNIIGSGVDNTKIIVNTGTFDLSGEQNPVNSQYFIYVSADNVSISDVTINNACATKYRTIRVVDELAPKEHKIANFKLTNVHFEGNATYDVHLYYAENAVFTNVTSSSSAWTKLYKQNGSTCTGTISKK